MALVRKGLAQLVTAQHLNDVVTELGMQWADRLQYRTRENYFIERRNHLTLAEPTQVTAAFTRRANGAFLRQLAEIGTVLDLLEKIQSQFFFFYKDMQCRCRLCRDCALSGKDEADYTTTLLFSPPDLHWVVFLCV